MNADSHILQDEMMQQYTTMHSTHTHTHTQTYTWNAFACEGTTEDISETRRDEARKEKSTATSMMIQHICDG